MHPINLLICCYLNFYQTQTPAQQVMFAPAQQMYQGPQPGVVIMQPSGQVTTMQAAYATQAQQPFFFPQQVRMQHFQGFKEGTV